MMRSAKTRINSTLSKFDIRIPTVLYSRQMSPTVTITVGERIIGKVNIEDVEVFKVAADALEDEAGRIDEVGETLGTLGESPVTEKRRNECLKLSKVLADARKGSSKS